MLSKLIADLDQGLALCDLNSLNVIEYNQTFASWFHNVDLQSSLSDLFAENIIKRINNSIVKKRKYRFKLEIKIASRFECIDLNTKLITVNNQTYLLIQCAINSTELKMEKLVKDHTLIANRNKKLLEQAIEKAETANNAKTMFLASMSHELRTPMNGILGMVQQFNKTHLSQEQTYCLETIERSGEQLLAIINQVLDFSKIEANKIELHPAPTDIKKLANDVISLCSSVTEASKQLTIKVVFSEQNYPTVLIDDIRLKQVLINLVNNAIKFTKKGYVTLELTTILINEHECKLKFSVIDSGVGISQDRIKTLFKPFTQHDSSTTRNYGGTGLGLTISSQLIELMNSYIKVSSHLQKGSKFSFILSMPITKKQKIITLKQAPIPSPTSLKNKTVLVVDDNRVNRKIVSMALDGTGAKIIEAINGQEAVEQFKAHKIDIILMDCLMPIMDGFEATEHIRKLEEKTKHTLIFAISASASSEIGERCLNIGMDDIMLKPFKFDELLYKITEHLP